MSSEKLARLYYQLFNERRLDEAGQLVHPQAVFHYIPTRQRLVGRAGYRALAAAWLNAFEDARLDVQRVTVSGDTVDVDFIGHGTHTGELVLGETFSLPATGRETELPFHDRLEVRDNLIARSELDFDVEEMKRRLLGPARRSPEGEVGPG
jgi:predicted ester cyclase